MVAFRTVLVVFALGFSVGFACLLAAQSLMIKETHTQLEPQMAIVNDRDYYESMENDIQSANKSILVAMYEMKYDLDQPTDPVNILCQELVDAKDRGVNVTVLIEYKTYFEIMNNNLDAFNYLKQHNIRVNLDNESSTDHTKLVVIDGIIVYVGSHNWSESSLSYNHETSVRIMSEDSAKTYSNYFWSIWESSS
jgi:phosphatidylserine/phosphatidylglycerophosphate/cardiolipin synthase-like enzyme